MKEKNRIIKEKAKKLYIKKFPNGHEFEKTDKIELDKTGKSKKNKGSHSLSALRSFQNNNR